MNLKPVRTSISLAYVVWEMAHKNMKALGYNQNFSAYVAALIRRDREEKLALELRLAELGMNQAPEQAKRQAVRRRTANQKEVMHNAKS